MRYIYRHIQPFERDKIARWLGQGKSWKAIAKKLHRQLSTVSREITRNSFQGKYYVAIHAQAKADTRRTEASERPFLKVSWIENYVINKLRKGWSPEQISGRLRKKHEKQIICVETVYQYIYHPDNHDLALWEYLRRHQKKRRHYPGRKVHKDRIPDRISIHDRPKVIDTRSRFGDWEGDTVEGQGHRDGLHTEVERLSRLLAAGYVSRIASEETVVMQKQIFSRYPEAARLSTTLDNGRENHDHLRLHWLNMATYFADPYCSGQRGTNENTNGLIRGYFPKGTNFSKISIEDIQAVVAELNDRPRKCLGYNTPKEVFKQQLKVALQR